MYAFREIIEVGGLAAYGPDLWEGAERLASQVDQVLKGAKPGDVPVHQASKFAPTGARPLALRRVVATSAASSGALLAAGISVRQINPFKLRQFVARMIALFVATMPTRPAQRNEAAERMAEIVTARRQLSDEKVAAENASRLFEDAILRRLYRRRLMRLALDIALLDKRLAAMVSANVALAQRYRLLTSMPGVGPVLAFTLIALLPELGQMSRRQVAELRTGRSARTHLPEGTHIVGQMGPTHCSFDHVVGEGEEWGRDVEAEGSGGLEVDNEIVPRGLLDRDLRGMRAAKNAVHKVRMAFSAIAVRSAP